MSARLGACLGALALYAVAGPATARPRSAAKVPGATLTSGFPVRTTTVGARGVRLDTGIDATCPRSGSDCRGRVKVTSAGGTTLGARLIDVRPGTTSRVRLRLNRRGAAAVRRHAIRARIAVTLTGPDGHEVGVVRMTMLPRPRSAS